MINQASNQDLNQKTDTIQAAKKNLQQKIWQPPLLEIFKIAETAKGLGSPSLDKNTKS